MTLLISIFNWYGKALDASFSAATSVTPLQLANASFGNSNFDFQAGYSHELYNGGPDLRLSVTGYKFDMRFQRIRLLRRR